MPKMRGIKPEIWTDDKFVELTPLARLLFIGLWNYACDSGHVEDKPLQIKMRILPADACDVADLLAELAAKGMIQREDAYLTIPNLPSHQRIDMRYFTACDHCDPALLPERAQRAPAGHTAGAQRAPALKEGRKEGEGEGEGEGSATGAPRKKRAIQLPCDWAPNDGHRSFAAENRLSIDTEAAQFRDHHAARGSTMKDWDAAFRTWQRNAVKFRGNQPALAAVRTDPYDESQLPPVEHSWMKQRPKR